MTSKLNTDLNNPDAHNQPVVRTVYAIGETVLDIIFRDGKVVSAIPGGSMLNTAVSLGRTGARVEFISDFGKDHPGELVADFLSKNGVSANWVNRYEKGKTTLALAFLDEQRNASYTFYRDEPAERLGGSFPEPAPGDIVLFGSFYALNPAVREPLTRFLEKAGSCGSIILYDPNFRKAHLAELPQLKPAILENIGLADLVRGSDEDFLHIFAAGSAGEARGHFPGDTALVYTAGDRHVDVVAGNHESRYPVPAIGAVSTVGAGDAFNAGLIRAILQANLFRKGLADAGEEQWREMVATGILFAQDVCLHDENYISNELVKSLASC